MEMFKFFKDKPFLISAAVIGLLNIFVTLFFVSALNASDTFWDMASAALAGLFTLFSFLLIMATGVLIFIYPFHAVSVDYKNNVLALMVASGVDRKKLYFSKVSAIILSSLILTAIVLLIPLIIILVQFATIVDIGGFFGIVSEVFNYLDLGFVKIILVMGLGYLSSLLIMIFSSIVLKGSKLAILLYFGFSMAVQFVRSILSTFAIGFAVSTGGGFFWFAIFAPLVTIGLFTFVSLRTLQRQNL